MVQVTKNQILTAGDGKQYQVTVTYDSDAGIPEDAELSVSELTEGRKYDKYVKKAAKKLGVSADSLAFARAFDIALMNPESGAHYQPAKPLKVRVKLLDEEPGSSVDVVHFGDKTEVLESSVSGKSVEFETDGFSVYVLTSQTLLCTYYFYSYDEYNRYVPYFFHTDQGTKTSALTIKNGETLYAPHNPSHPTDQSKAFIGWFQADLSNPDSVTLEDTPFDFDKPQEVTQGTTAIYLYAKFSRSVTVRFHSQYDSTLQDYPVSQTVEIDPTGNATIDLNAYSVAYHNPDGSNAYPAYEFQGWSETPIQTPGGGENQIIVTNYNAYPVTNAVDLYPIFRSINWLTLVSGHSGTSATYYAPMPKNAGESIAIDALPVPTRPGCTFTGWYLDVSDPGTDAQNGAGTQLVKWNSTGTALEFCDVENIAIGVKVETNSETGVKTLLLSKNVNLYAGWTPSTVRYSIVVWTQRATDADGLPDSAKCYDYTEIFAGTAPLNASESVADAYKTLNNVDSYNNVHDSEHQLTDNTVNPYAGYTFNVTNSEVGPTELDVKGSTVFNLYYDWTSQPAISAAEHTLTFHYLEGASPSAAAPGDSIHRYSAQASLSSLSIPDAPGNGKKADFYWYADEGCTARVFFNEADYVACSDANKVLYTTMPNRDLTVYGKWRRFNITIDPNYGAMADVDDANGNGATWFKLNFGESIEEYTHVTRNYVESESGNFYYVLHDKAFQDAYQAANGTDAPDRHSYYTEDVSKATEYKTFKNQPNVYIYDGWYEVHEDGSETRYDFSHQNISHDITLKLHWKLAGCYYLEYNADVTGENGLHLSGTLDGYRVTLEDSKTYVDQSSITLMQTAEPPDGYDFIGWRVRGDTSGTVYYPGRVFALPAEYAVTMGEKYTVFLDAVYGKSSTAKIVYDANGGTVLNDEALNAKLSAGLDSSLTSEARSAALKAAAQAANGYPFTTKTEDVNGVDTKVKVPLSADKYSITSTDHQLTVSGLGNNTQFCLSNGDRFSYTDPVTSEPLLLTGWYALKEDGTRERYAAGADVYVDTAEPVTLHAEWKIRVYFDKNNDAASWSTTGWDGYTLVDSPGDPHDGQYYIETTAAALLSEPAGTAELSGKHFDYWSTEANVPAGQEQTLAFDFTSHTTTPSLTLYAQYTDSNMVPFHVTDRGMDKDEDWRPTPVLRVSDAGMTLDQSTLSTYLNLPEGYQFCYACAGNSINDIPGVTVGKTIQSITKSGDTITVTYSDNSTANLGANQVIQSLSVENGIVQAVYVDDNPSNPHREALDTKEIYLVYAPQSPVAPTVKIVYVKEVAGGNLEKIRGADASSPNVLTYNGAPKSINNDTVQQEQTVAVGLDQFNFSQDSHQSFNMLPLLDDGTNLLSLTYYKIGVGGAFADGMTIDTLGDNISNELKLCLQVRDNKLKWSFDRKTWTPFTESTPVVYAIYRERGYNLTLHKTVSKGESGVETGISPDKTFDVTISSMYIIRDSYTVEGTGYSTVAATPASGTTPGKIHLKVKDGSKIKIIGAAQGEYTFTETHNDGFALSYKVNNAAAFTTAADNQSFSATVENDTEVRLKNDPKLLCRIPKSGEDGYYQFYTLNKALEKVRSSEYNGEAEIQMLRDYIMPSSDKLSIPATYNITLKSRPKISTDTNYRPFIISRDEEFNSGAMFTNAGTLTVEGLTLDGSGVSVAAPILKNTGTLTLGSDAVSGSEAQSQKAVTLRNANSSAGGGAVSMEGGSLTIKNYATFSDNTAKRGGAIYVTDGQVSIGNCSFTSNSAESGGAIYVNGQGILTVSGASMTKNTAGNGSGGAICMEGGQCTITSGTIGGSDENKNTASENGGAVYVNNAVLDLQNGTISFNEAQNGGAIYAQTGTVSVKGGSLTENKAVSTKANSGHGGAIFLQEGTLTVSGGSMTKNTALTGFGGAVYIGSGALGMKAGTIGGGPDETNANQARNGSGVYVDSGDASFSGSAKVSWNRAVKYQTDLSDIATGGGIGIGQDAARLHFSGSISIYNNMAEVNKKNSGALQTTTEWVQSNVYLKWDTDAIINVDGELKNEYSLGIYVPQIYESDLFEHRGTVTARFGSYLEDKNYSKAIKNDRMSSLKAGKVSAANKLYWYSDFYVRVRAWDDYSTELPHPNDDGTVLQNTDKEKKDVVDAWYTPPSSKNKVSEIAEDYAELKKISLDNRIFAAGFVYTKNSNQAVYASSFDDYITEINWSNEKQKWVAKRRDGSTVDYYYFKDKNWLTLYYSQPAYLSIENNDSHTLTINSLTVSAAGANQNAINTSSQTGFGYVVSIDGETQSSLMPIETATFPAGKKTTVDGSRNLVLQPGGSVKLLFPGCSGKQFQLTGSFSPTDPDTSISYTLTGESGSQTTTASGGMNLTRNLLSAVGGTYEIILGGKKVICKIVPTTANPVTGTPVEDTDYVRLDHGEYLFATLNQAVSFTNQFITDKKTKIEMLTDYLISTSNIVSIPAGCDITFTTALTGTNQYPTSTDPSVDNSKRRATLSRDIGNISPLISMEIQKSQTGSLSVDKLNFDGKNLGGTNDFGIIRTNNCKVSVTNADFKDCKAKSGGGISIDYDEDYAGDYGLTVDTCRFVGCSSTTGQRVGGGAVWTCAKVMYLRHCYFEKCTADDQGGAVFHRIDAKKVGANKSNVFTYAKDSKSIVEDCQFINCEAKAAGGFEADTYYIEMTDCTFRNCRAKERNGGGVNIYIYEDSGDNINITDANTDSHSTEAKFVGCVFENCSANKLGGGIRSLCQTTQVWDCTFKNCTSKDEGGAVMVKNQYATSLEVLGCTMQGCKTTNSDKQGGGVYCNAKSLKIGDYDYQENNRTPKDTTVGIYRKDGNGVIQKRSTEIEGCTATGNGGGVAFVRDGSKSTDTITCSITNATISGNKTSKTGGGVYTKAKKTTITGCTIANNVATGNGGGVCMDVSGSATYDADYNYNSDSFYLILDSTTVKGNSTGAKGGGCYVNCPLTLRNDTKITENRLSDKSAPKTDCAGVFLRDKCTLTVGGAQNASGKDGTSVKDNVTAGGGPSNLRLWEDSTNKNNADSVHVLCDLSGKIYVVNAGTKSKKFGISSGKFDGFSGAGFKELDHTFIADDGSLYGVFDRMDTDDSNGWDVIWRGDVICKLTDNSGTGRLLYLDADGKEPAIFDRLDYATAGSKVSPFSYLRGGSENCKLWIQDANDSTVYHPFDPSTTTCCVRLMVESYSMEKQIDTGSYATSVILTTAGKTDSLYPYTGKSSTRATIQRGSVTKSMILAKTNLTVRNLILDGASVSVGEKGALINAGTQIASPITVTLADNALLTNGVSSNNGGGLYLDKGNSLTIEGGIIDHCSAKNGGGVYQSDSGNTAELKFTSGLITECTATGSGGGINLTKGKSLSMSGGSQITLCSAQKGGGVWVNEGKTMNLQDCSIMRNTATDMGGGIATEKKAKLYFSGRVVVSGNTLNGEPCNVQPEYLSSAAADKNKIINSTGTGLSRGSYVGVYVSGTFYPLTDEDKQAGRKHNANDEDPYKSHGAEDDPFGTWSGDNRFLYFFVNDRNGLKGGLRSSTTSDDRIYWTTIFSLKVSKTVMRDTADTSSGEEFVFTVKLEGVDSTGTTNANTITELSEEWPDDTSVTYWDYSADAWKTGQSVPFTQGQARFKLTSGQDVTWHNLPAGISYKVTEELTTEQSRIFRTFPSVEVSGQIGENLNRNDVSSKYLSEVAYKNMTVVCKLTYEVNGGVLLYTMNEETGIHSPAVFASLNNAFTTVNNSTPLYYRDAFNSNKWTQYQPDKECQVEMLVQDYSLTEQASLSSDKKVVLTKAGKDDTDGYPYIGGDNPAVIKRGYNGNSMLSTSGRLTLTDITLDGNKKGSKSTNANGGIVTVASSGALVIHDKAVLCNSKSTGSSGGGAVYVDGGSVQMDGGSITGNESTGYGGGAIRLQSGTVTISGTALISDNSVKNKDANGGGVSVRVGTLNISGGTICNNSATNEGVPGADKVQGGGVYLKSGTTLNLTGGSIYENTVTGTKADGAGIYVSETAKLYLSGNPDFGGPDLYTQDVTENGVEHKKDDIKGERGNFAAGTLSGETNGGKAYSKKRQDIFLTGYESATNADSLVVTGSISSGAGSIWVWAEESPHYKTLKQFAKLRLDAGTTLDETQLQSTLEAFRNARSDVVSENDTDSYLHGTSAEELGETEGYVYWNGVRGTYRVILRKVNGVHAPLPGATMTVYRKGGVTVYQYKDENGQTHKLENLTTDNSGVYWIGMLPYGEYWVHESKLNGADKNWWFVLTVDASGVTCSERRNTKPTTT